MWPPLNAHTAAPIQRPRRMNTDGFCVCTPGGLLSRVAGPTGELQLPPVLNLALFERISAALPGEQQLAFLEAARNYIRESYDADELVQFAQRRKQEGGPDADVVEYVDLALAAARRASDNLQRIVSLLPPMGTAAPATASGPSLTPDDTMRILAPRDSPFVAPRGRPGPVL